MAISSKEEMQARIDKLKKDWEHAKKTYGSAHLAVHGVDLMVQFMEDVTLGEPPAQQGEENDPNEPSDVVSPQT